MAVQVQCPSCGAIYAVFEAAVGRRVRCPDCHELVAAEPHQVARAPSAQETGDDPEADSDEGLIRLDNEGSAGLAGAQAAQPPAAKSELSLDATPPAWEDIEVMPPPRVVPPVPPAGYDVGSSAGPPPLAESGPPSRHKAIIFRHERRRPEGEIDMTPMVDVVFQLLIFFMLTASFSMQKSLQVPKPEKAGTSSQPRSVQEFIERADYIVVRVDSYNTYYVNAAAFEDEIEAPSEQELLVKLRQARRGDQRGNIPTKMLVVANGDALHERVVTAIDAGNEIGMEEVQLATVDDE